MTDRIHQYDISDPVAVLDTVGADIRHDIECAAAEFRAEGMDEPASLKAGIRWWQKAMAVQGASFTMPSKRTPHRRKAQ